MPGKQNLEKTKKHYWNAKFHRRAHTKLTPIDAEQLSLALFICSYMFQGLALVDLANLKWGDIRDIEVLDKEKYARDSGEYGVINVARSKTNKPVRILVEQMTVLPFLLPFTEAIKNVPDDEVDDMYVFPIYSARHTYASALYHANVPMGLIAQNMGRNPAEIETYLKDRTRNVMMLLKNRNVCRCRKSSYICDVKWCRKAIGNYG